MKRNLLLLFATLLTAFRLNSLNAQIVETVANGAWSSPFTWSTGSVPTGAEDIRVHHKVSHASTLFILSAGKLTILSGGKVTITQDLDNTGEVWVYDSLVTGGMENKGRIYNHSLILQNGTMQNRNTGKIENYGLIRLFGDLENHGYFYSTGDVFMTGDLENYGTITSPAGASAYFDVCGSATHRDYATVSGMVYLCIRCGGSYVQQPKRIGDFIEQCNPFAVSLIDFQARLDGPGIVRLRWQTASETNHAWFVVERAHIALAEECLVGKCESPVNFTEIGKVPGAGNSSTLRSYLFTDGAPKQGVNFYRLRLIDNTGDVTWSPTISIIVGAAAPSLMAYPNPNQDILHLRLRGNAGQEATITLFSIDGKRVWQQASTLPDGSAEIELSTCQFASGTYILEFKQGNHKETRKVVFQK